MRHMTWIALLIMTAVVVVVFAQTRPDSEWYDVFIENQLTVGDSASAGVMTYLSTASAIERYVGTTGIDFTHDQGTLGEVYNIDGGTGTTTYNYSVVIDGAFSATAGGTFQGSDQFSYQDSLSVVYAQFSENQGFDLLLANWNEEKLHLGDIQCWEDETNAVARCKDGAPSSETDGINIMANKSQKFWAFSSPSGASGTFYWGGFYHLNSGNNNFSSPVNFGTANSSYSAHFFVVTGAATSDTVVITVTGTSITDAGVRTTSDTDTITLTHPTSANTYAETPKKWLGQVSVSTTSGTPIQHNYGYSKYWDDDNTDFTVVGLEATWLGGANDSAPDIQLFHHKATGWTYNAGSTPTPPTALASMATDHSTEDNVKNGENGAWKRTGLSTDVDGSGSEGILFAVTTTANKAFEAGTLQVSLEK